MKWYFDPGHVARMTPAQREAVKNELHYASELVHVRVQASELTPQRSQHDWLREVPAELGLRGIPNDGSGVAEAVRGERATILGIIETCADSHQGVGGDAPLDRCLGILYERLKGVWPPS